MKQATASNPGVLLDNDLDLSDDTKLDKPRRSRVQVVDEREVHDNSYTYPCAPGYTTLEKAFAEVEKAYQEEGLPRKVESEIKEVGCHAASSRSVVLQKLPCMPGTLCSCKVPQVTPLNMCVWSLKVALIAVTFIDCWHVLNRSERLLGAPNPHKNNHENLMPAVCVRLFSMQPSMECLICCNAAKQMQKICLNILSFLPTVQNGSSI